MKEFCLRVSLTSKIKLLIRAEDKEKAENIAFEHLEGMKLVFKDGTTSKTCKISWGEARHGNDSVFEIEEI